MDSENTKKPINKKIIFAAVAIIALAAIIAVIIILASSKKDEYRIIKIKSFEGDVKVQRVSSESFDAFEGLQLVSEDSVEVGTDSFLELLADSDKHIGAQADTGFILHSSGTSKKGRITIELLYGKALFTIDEKLNDDSLFEVTTPNATLSVRGTQFSVKYDPVLNETTVEVMEGKVWITSEGMAQILEAGNSIVIGGNGPIADINDSEIPYADNIPTPDMDTDNYELQFMLTRYYQNVPDYATAPAEGIELYILNEISNKTAYVTPDGTNATGNLERSALEIDNQYIEPLMDKANAVFESRKYELIQEQSKGTFPEPIDVTDWFDDFNDREITVNGDDFSFTFEIKKVTMDWIYAIMEPDENGEFMVYHTLDYAGSDGNHYSITGITFTFMGISK